MKFSIELTKQEIEGIKAYISDLDPDTFPHPFDVTIEAVRAEVKERMYNALRDPREAISTYILPVS